MPPDASAPPEKLSLIVYSGAFAKVHYALAMASAAAAVNIPATLFFTMQAIHALKKDAGGVPGWHRLPGTDGREAVAIDADFQTRGVATFAELLIACRDLGVRFMVCEMGLRAVGLTAADLRDDIDYVEGGLVTFYQDAAKDGSMVFI